MMLLTWTLHVAHLLFLRRLLLISLHCLQRSLEQMISSMAVMCEHVSDHEVGEAVHMPTGLQDHLWGDGRTLHLCTTLSTGT